MTESLPHTAHVRISTATFDPARLAEVQAGNMKTSEYLIPAIQKLPGLIHYYVGVSPEGSMVHVSVWDSEEHASQLSQLKEMTVIAREEMEGLGAAFRPIINYPIDWTI